MQAETQFTERLLTWLDVVDDTWANAGLTRVERRRLAAELESSIREGLESGASEEDFVGDAPSTVAADIAMANGLPLRSTTPRTEPEPTRRTFRNTALVGAAIGVAAAWLVLLASPYLLPFNSAASWVVLYSCVLACPLTGAAIAIRRRYPHEPYLVRLQVLAVVGVLLGGLLAAVPCWALARALDYPSTSVLVLPELLLGLAICALILDLAWRLGWRKQPTTG